MLKSVKSRSEYLLSSVILFFRNILHFQEKNARKTGNFTSAAHVTSIFIWPNIDKKQYEVLLKGKPDGTFLVREMKKARRELEILYTRNNRIVHMKIDYNERKKVYGLDLSNKKLPKTRSIEELINSLVEKCENHSLVVTKDSGEKFELIKLKFPMKRSITLMEHCKKAILLSNPNIDVDGMLVPRDVKEFIKL